MISKENLVLFLASVTTILLNADSATSSELKSEDSVLNFTQLAGKYGYKAEEHNVITEDGYILTIFRMKGRQCKGNRRPVIMMHGLLMSSDAFLDAGPKNGLTYLLADSCHDLWVGNSRGNYYSKAHTTLNPNEAQFWSFSYDEIGYYDVPATINYVLKQTGFDKVNYIGFSQGSGTVFVMCSERPRFCDKINVLISLAPAARQTNSRSNVYRTICITCWKFESLLSQYGIYEVFGKNVRDFFSYYCKLNDEARKDCGTVLSILDSFHPRSVSASTIETLVGHFPAGTSLHNMAKYGQSMASEHFEKFNYGPENLKIYGQRDPPKYNLSAVTVPVVVIYGENDGVVDTKDVEWLVSLLPNVVETWLVQDPKWTHLDVTYSRYIAKSIFPKIKQYLLRFS